MRTVLTQHAEGLFFPEVVFEEGEEAAIQKSLLQTNPTSTPVRDLDSSVEAVIGVFRPDLQVKPKKGQFPTSKFFDGEQINHMRLYQHKAEENGGVCDACAFKTKRLFLSPKDENHLNPDLDNWYLVCILCRNVRDISMVVKDDSGKKRPQELAVIAYLPEMEQSSLNHLQRCAFSLLNGGKSEQKKLVASVLGILYKRSKVVATEWGSNLPIEFASALTKCNLEAYVMREMTMYGLRVLFHPKFFEDRYQEFAADYLRTPLSDWYVDVFEPLANQIFQIKTRGDD